MYRFPDIYIMSLIQDVTVLGSLQMVRMFMIGQKQW